MDIVYVIGTAGTGKTTLIDELTSRWEPRSEIPKPIYHRHFLTDKGRAIVLGKNKPPFSGTDTLSYTAINYLPAWLQEMKALGVSYIVGEGDRLAVDRFMEAAKAIGTLHLYHLTTTPTVTAERRKARAERYGLKLQNEGWLSASVTKHSRLAARHGAIELDATTTPKDNADLICVSLNLA
jgi:GTPase SAR1 family protein